MSQRGQTVQEPGRRDGHADARTLGQEARRGGGVARMLLVPERHVGGFNISCRDFQQTPPDSQ